MKHFWTWIIVFPISLLGKPSLAHLLGSTWGSWSNWKGWTLKVIEFLNILPFLLLWDFSTHSLEASTLLIAFLSLFCCYKRETPKIYCGRKWNIPPLFFFFVCALFILSRYKTVRIKEISQYMKGWPVQVLLKKEVPCDLGRHSCTRRSMLCTSVFSFRSWVFLKTPLFSWCHLQPRLDFQWRDEAQCSEFPPGGLGRTRTTPSSCAPM